MLDITMSVSNPMTFDRRVEAAARSLAAEGHRVRVLATRGKSLPARQHKDGYQIIRCFEGYPQGKKRYKQLLRAHRLYKFGSVPGAELYASLLRHGGDVFHLHDLDTLVPGTQAAKKLGIPYIYDSHELFLGEIQGDRREKIRAGCAGRIRRKYWSIMEKRYILRAHSVISSNGSIGRVLKWLYPEAPDPVPILNCPTLANISPQGVNLRDIYGQNGRILLIYHGILGIGRGLATMLRSLHELDPSFVLILLGGDIGSGVEKAKAQAARLGLADRVLFHPAVPTDQVIPTIATADIGILPIEPVNFNKRLAKPNKLFECLLAGLPTVGTSLPEIKSVLEQIHKPSLFRPYDHQGLARAIRSMPLGPKSQKIRQAGRDLARARYSGEVQMERLIGIYRKIKAVND